MTAKLPPAGPPKNDWSPPSWVNKKLPQGLPAEAVYSPSRRAWLIPSTGQIVEDDSNGR
jgi:hypothetical protein